MDSLYYLSITDLLKAFTERVRVGLCENKQIRLVEDEMLDQHSLAAHCRSADDQRVKWLRFISS
jgi:hypothetical protein